MMQVRTGVIGVGALGYHHARILRDLAGSTLAGVHDSNAARLQTVGGELGVATFADADALLEQVDACVIAVPTQAHERAALGALARGVHVLIEKPIAPSLESADRILAAAADAGAIVQIGHVERFNGAVRACEPYFDNPLFVESHRLAPFNPRGTDVAVVLDLMIHDLDLVLSIMKRPVQSLAAVGVPVLTGSPDIANARIEFEGGGVANLTASRVSIKRERKIRFFQRSGYISLDLATGTGEFLRLRPGVNVEEKLAALAAGSADANPLVAAAGLLEIVERVSLSGDGVEPLRPELESFVAAVRGEGSVAVSGEDGRRALAVALDINDRIRTHVSDRDPA
jgi:predicted dehydrogenase